MLSMAKSYQAQNVSSDGVEKPKFLVGWALLGKLSKKIDRAACLLIQCFSRIKICSCIFPWTFPHIINPQWN